MIGKRQIGVTPQKLLGLRRFGLTGAPTKGVVFEVWFSRIIAQFGEDAIETGNLVAFQRKCRVVKKLTLVFDAGLRGRSDRQQSEEACREYAAITA